MVTIEDLLEEIVGDILDEYDNPEEDAALRATQAGDLIVNGGALISELNDAYSVDFPVGDYDTIAGLVINQLGRIPAAGEMFEYNGVKMRIERVSQNRIVRLRLLKGAKMAIPGRG